MHSIATLLAIQVPTWALTSSKRCTKQRAVRLDITCNCNTLTHCLFTRQSTIELELIPQERLDRIDLTTLTG